VSVSDYELTCIVEIPKGSRNKYEYDPALGAIKLDRFISASVVYPTDYGYVPETLAPDGDALDVLVCVSEPTFPGCVVVTKAVAQFKMADEKGPDDHVV
jgi:inorganic pyrophosphatase